jgi:hypothetical protein
MVLYIVKYTIFAANDNQQNLLKYFNYFRKWVRRSNLPNLNISEFQQSNMSIQVPPPP